MAHVRLTSSIRPNTKHSAKLSGFVFFVLQSSQDSFLSEKKDSLNLNVSFVLFEAFITFWGKFFSRKESYLVDFASCYFFQDYNLEP